MQLPKGMTAQKLRIMADWFDTYEFIIERQTGMLQDRYSEEAIDGIMAVITDKTAQADIRVWADEIDAQADDS